MNPVHQTSQKASIVIFLSFSSLFTAGWTLEGNRIAGAKINPSQSTRIELVSESGQDSYLTTTKPVLEVEPSPDGQYVGALVAMPINRSEPLHNTSLYIWNRSGTPLLKLPNVQKFSFSPNAKFVAAILGKPYEGALGFVSKGVKVIKLPSLAQTTVQGLNSARNIAWVKRPGLKIQLFAEITEKNKIKIVRYSPQTRRIYPTKLKGLNCSPDGRYYFLSAREAEQAGVCRPRGPNANGCVLAYTWDNQRVRLPSKLRFNHRWMWAQGEGHRVIFQRAKGRKKTAALLDIASGAMEELDEPIDWSWRTRPGRMLLKNKGKKGVLPRKIKNLKHRKWLNKALKQQYKLPSKN